MAQLKIYEFNVATSRADIDDILTDVEKITLTEEDEVNVNVIQVIIFFFHLTAE